MHLRMSNSNYKLLFKATGLFGIVEALRIVLRIGVNKFASVFLGPSSYGVVGLVDNIIQLIGALTSFGINFIGIREIAANKLSDKNKLNNTIKSIHIFIILTGALAAIVSVMFSAYLSKLTFGTQKYTIWFILLSIYFVCNSFVQSKTILLEGLQDIRKLLTINIVCNIVNVTIIIGCYYMYNTIGIILSMILTSFINMLLFLRGTKKYDTSHVKIAKQELENNIKYFAKSGSLLALNSCIGLFGYFLIRIYLKPIDQGIVLSYYNVGNILMVSYVGIIFISINKFYFPKLSETIITKNQENINRLVNNQLEICFLLLIPAILFLYLFGTFCLQVLFSIKFVLVYKILIFGLLSIFVRGFNYILGYLILSNKNFKQYFYINSISDILNTVLTIILYKYLELYGIGLAFLVNYLLSAVYTFYYVNKKYNLKVENRIKKLLICTATIGLIIVTSYFKFTIVWFNTISSIFFILSIIYSTYKLDDYLLNKLLRNKIVLLLKKVN